MNLPSLTSSFRIPLVFALSAGSGLYACGGDPPEPEGVDGGRSSGGSGGAATGGGGGVSGSTGTGGIPITGGASSTSGGAVGVGGVGGSGETCAVQKAGTNLLPVRLAFAFDVSGSMGQNDFPWHDPTLKWDPVVAATRAFFEDAASAGLEASLTAFPVAEQDAKCEDGSYEMPIVPMTALPSTAFGTALDGIRAGEWRGGTPTLHVVNGVLSYIAAQPANQARYVLVLVTDGYPQGCSNNSIEAVVGAVSAVAANIPTYVIGVANPPLTDMNGMTAPETVMNLSAVAVAGGTGQAYIIDTGDPAATRAAFTAAINQIRGTSITCNLDIPPIPGGRAFERDKVIVTYTSNGTPTELTYDATCMQPNSWHYDDPAAPTEIVLCDTTCAVVQADEMAELGVTFTCTSVIDPR